MYHFDYIQSHESFYSRPSALRNFQIALGPYLCDKHADEAFEERRKILALPDSERELFFEDRMAKILGRLSALGCARAIATHQFNNSVPIQGLTPQQKSARTKKCNTLKRHASCTMAKALSNYGVYV